MFVQPGEKEMRDFTIPLPTQWKVTEKIKPKDTVCINWLSGYVLGNKCFHSEGSQTLGQVALRRQGISIFGYIQILADKTWDNIIQFWSWFWVWSQLYADHKVGLEDFYNPFQYKWLYDPFTHK